MNLKRCREILGNEANNYSDDDIQKLIELLYKIGHIIIQIKT